MVTKPTKPVNDLPSSFGGTKTNFSAEKIQNGYEPDVPDILGGANLNYLLDTLGKKEVYYDSIVDFINNLPIGKTITVNSNNELTYANNIDFSSRHIGEIIQSTVPLTDAGVHLLDGALIDGSGIYANFVDYIAGLFSTYPNIFVSEVTWQTSVATYGVCGKFVYDSINNTVRLPKITGFIEGTLSTNTLDDLTRAGLPNITGTFKNGGGSLMMTGAIVGRGTWTTSGVVGRVDGGSDANYTNEDASLDASRSSSIYGQSSTVQPQSIKVLYYIVLATGTKTNVEVDIDEVVTDLNGKASRDLDNLSPEGEAKLSPIPIGKPQITLNFDFLPTNCIWLEGAEVSRTTYANLFAIYGVSYGEGDGSTTFKLPDFRDRAIWGATTPGYIAAGLPNITGKASAGEFTAFRYSEYSSTGALGWDSTYSYRGNKDSAEQSATLTFNASNSNSIYGNSSTVQPPALKVRVYTRYQ